MCTAIFVVCGRYTQINMPHSKKMAVNTRSWSQFFSVSFSEYSGYVMSLEDAIKLLKEYEDNTTTTFTVAYQSKGFGNSPMGKNDFNLFFIFLQNFIVDTILLLITWQNRQL